MGDMTPLYKCIGCGDVHEPDDREPHDFLLGNTVCPECDSKRFEVIRDYDGPVGDELVTLDG